MPHQPIALITGSSRGIGAEIARTLAAGGGAVAINYVRDADAARAVAESIIAQGGTADIFAADVAIAEQAADLVARIIGRFGALHTLVNNAGVYASSMLEQSDSALVERIFGVNVMGLLAVTRAAAPHLVAAAASSPPGTASIINITSVAARAHWGGAAIYCASKAAAEALTRCHAAELGPKGVRVNAVAPGVTETDINRAGMTAEFRKKVSEGTKLGRIGEVRDIAPLVAFLAGPGAAWITGQIIDADGGFRP